MSNGSGMVVDNKEFINKMFNLNLKYVNNYSEFLSNSMSLNWQNLVSTDNNDRHIDKLKKNLNKIEKMENKKSPIVDIDVIKKENIEEMKKLGKGRLSRFSKRMMESVESFNSLTKILNYYLELYVDIIDSEHEGRKKNELEKVVENIKLKKKVKDLPEEKVVYSQDRNGNYYSNIVIENNKMSFDEESFQIEFSKYKDLLNSKEDYSKSEVKLNFSPYEKKRRIYIKSMYEMDKSILGLLNKDVDITFPVEKVYRIAEELVNYIYKENVDYEIATSVLNTLTNKTIDTYGSKIKINLYNELVTDLSKKLSRTDKYIYQEIVSSTNSIKDSMSFKEFKNIKGLFPTIEDIYIAANEMIFVYVRRNVTNFINNLDKIKYLVRNMSILEIVHLYDILKEEVFNNKLSSKYFILVQEVIVNCLKDKFNLKEEVIFKDILSEKKMY